MMRKTKIICSIGTRPEAIKMAPVIIRLKQEAWCQVFVLGTAQHREMLDQTLSFFNIGLDGDLNVMEKDQSLTDLTHRLLTKLDGFIRTESPDLMLAQGDTTTTFLTALGAFYHRVPFGHIEAGLRTHNKFFPYPEEMNRALTARLADFHFAPTQEAKKNLLQEGILETRIWVTGNTVIDALFLVDGRKTELPFGRRPSSKLVLVTAHRRENFGQPFLEVCKALRELIQVFPDIEIVYPVHPNPHIHGVAHRELKGFDRITLLPPLDYGPFVATMRASCLILTDSGGIQEEATILGIPVLLLRDETERPEAVDAGIVKVVGPRADAILKQASPFLSGGDCRKAAISSSPYGDGKAAVRIASILKEKFIGEGITSGPSRF